MHAFVAVVLFDASASIARGVVAGVTTGNRLQESRGIIIVQLLQRVCQRVHVLACMRAHAWSTTALQLRYEQVRGVCKHACAAATALLHAPCIYE